ncbi:MAG: hypothetical protein L6R39_004178 [Caloplaca ligustica]|nr:MAG: hypothetical protein L6R39_004178 [Caloplaca ligustica]
MADRRRINPPLRPTAIPIFASSSKAPSLIPRHRTRPANEIRKVFLKTGLTPSASGSAYFEVESTQSTTESFLDRSSSLKITCSVHGPRPLPRSQPFSPHLLLSVNVKFAPFASRHRRGYIRDASERDLAVHVETALRGLLISARWPKSGVDVVITVLEGEEDEPLAAGDSGEPREEGGLSGWGMMSVLSGCITVASAAIADAGIDCVDLVSGGVAAIVRPLQAPGRRRHVEDGEGEARIVLDPSPSEHQSLAAVCVVGYLQSRDEVTEIWLRGDVGGIPSVQDSPILERVVDQAVEAAMSSRLVLEEALKESVKFKLQKKSSAEAVAGAKWNKSA